MGFTHKQCVHILYAISGILGLASVCLAAEKSVGKTVAIIAVALVIMALYFIILRNPATRHMSGLAENEPADSQAEPLPPESVTEAPLATEETGNSVEEAPEDGEPQA